MQVLPNHYPTLPPLDRYIRLFSIPKASLSLPRTLVRTYYATVRAISRRANRLIWNVHGVAELGS